MKKIFLLLAISSLAYLTFAQVPGYYNGTENITGDELKAQLHEIIKGHVDFSYSDAKFILNYADEDPTNSKNLIQLYTNRSVSKDDWGTGGDLTNREHVWAKSHGNFENIRPMDGDAHNLHAADGSVNVTRSNYDFDNVTGGTYITEADAYYGGGAFEPADRDKGVIARTILYMAVRYEGTDNELDLEVVDAINTASKAEHGKLSTLLEWNNAYPPTEFEKRRNERVFQSQLNRNPFIDNPKFADIIWDNAQVTGTTISMVEMTPKHPKISDNITISATFTNSDLTPTATLYWGKSFNSETYSSVFSGTGAMSASIDLTGFTDNDLVYLKTVTSDGVVKYNSFYVSPNKTLTEISAIQGTGDASPMQGSTVTISGIVTANFDNSFYMQSGTGKYSGMCVYSNWRGRIGDSVTVTGKATEYSNLTELGDVTMVYSYGLKDTLKPVVLPISQVNEDYEGMFIQINNATFSAPNTTIPTGGGTYSLSDETGSIPVYIRYNSRLVGKIIPEGTLQVKAILSQYGSGYQLLIDNIDWVVYTSETIAPEANQDKVNTDKNTAVQILPLENDVFNPGITLEISKNGSNGNAEIPFTNPNAITYTPNTDFTGVDTVQYKIYYSAQPELSSIGDIIITILGNSISTTKIPSFTLFPNPNKGIFTVNLKNNTEHALIKVSDLSGRLIYKAYFTNGEHSKTIQLNGLAEIGCYIIEVDENNRVSTKKLIIE